MLGKAKAVIQYISADLLPQNAQKCAQDYWFAEAFDVNYIKRRIKKVSGSEATDAELKRVIARMTCEMMDIIQCENDKQLRKWLKP